MKTENELIAEFMGGIKKEHPMSTIGYWDFPDYPAEGHARQVKHLKYDISWDWLMPVVEKITPIAKEKGQQAWFDIGSSLTIASISQVYKRVIEFIKWYNSQNS